jgi:hypothetical protein
MDIEKAIAVNVREAGSHEEEHAQKYAPDQPTGDVTADKPSRVDTWYLWEVAGVVGSAACICAIVGLLASLDGKKLPVWGATTPEKTIKGHVIPSKTVNVSLNSVISWISTVGKIAILIPITVRCPFICHKDFNLLPLDILLNLTYQSLLEIDVDIFLAMFSFSCQEIIDIAII